MHEARGVAMRQSDSEKFLRLYRWACMLAAVIGVSAAVYFWAIRGPALGLTFVVLTTLLLPAYSAAAWRARRGR
jgi:hypothetical protein